MLIDSKTKYLEPETINDAMNRINVLSEAKFLAGGTDLIPLMKYGVKKPEYLISLERLKALDYINFDNNYFSIGALTKLDVLANDHLIKRYLPSLSYAAKCVASPQIRNIATIGGNILQDRRCIYFNQTAEWRQNIDLCFKTGGNICHQAKKSQVCRALYYSDIAPVLMALNAVAVIIENGAEKEIPVNDLILVHSAKNGTTENTNMLIKGFKIKYYERYYNKFYKYSVRQSIDFPIMNIAVCFNLSEEKNNNDRLKILVGAINSYPIELIETQKSIISYLYECNCNLNINDICENAIREMSEKCSLVRETGISLKSKRMNFNNIEIAIKDFINSVNVNIEK